jgi:hypothetical protein
MNRPSSCRSARRLPALRGPPGCRSFCPRLPASQGLLEVVVLPHLITQLSSAKARGKAEGKIKGGGTSLARKAVCTGVGGDTAPVSPSAEIVLAPQRPRLRSVPDTPYCDQLGGV